MALSAQDLVDIRRHAGYGAFGTDGNQSLLYYRYYRQFAMLEYRMQNLSAEETTTLQTYIQNCNLLESDMVLMRTAMIVESAAVFHRNMNEMSDRLANYTFQRKQLLAFLQLPAGPWFVAGGDSMRIVV